MGTKTYNNYEDLLTFTRASGGHALRPVSYGDELVDDGTFDEGTVPSGWQINTANGVLSIVNGALQARDTNGDTYIADYELTNLKIGGIYKIEYTDSGVNTIALGSSRGDHSDIISLPATSDFHQVYVVTTKSTHYFGFRRNNGITETIDNVSVKEVLFDQPDGTLTLFEHPENIPRVEYDADGNRLGLLVEEARTNLIVYSDFSGGWIEVSVEPVAFNQTGPDGVANSAITLQDNGAGGSSGSVYIQDNGISISASTIYTASVFVKAGNNSQIEIETRNDDAIRGGLFDISTETFTPFASETGTIQSVGNGWYRCAVTWTSGTDTSIGLRVGFPSITRDGTNTIYLYGAQFEEGSFPTSYIKNEGTTSGKDRSADVASIPVADFGFNTGAGTFVAEFDFLDPENDDANYVISGGSDARIIYNNANQDAWLTFDGANSVSFGALDNTGASRFKAAVAVNESANDTATFLDGNLKGTRTLSFSLMTNLKGEDLNIGNGFSSGQKLNGHIKSIQYYPRRLTNAQLQDLTS